MLPVTPPPHEPKVWRGWDPQKMEAAIQMYRRGGVSIREAARKFEQTDAFYRAMQRRLQHQPHTHKLPDRPGPPTLFSNEQEAALIGWIGARQRARYPPTRREIMAKAATVAAESGVSFGTPDGHPSDHWWRWFRARHPTLAPRPARALAPARADVTQKELSDFVATYQTELARVLAGHSTRRSPYDNPLYSNRVWNADEIGLGAYSTKRINRTVYADSAIAENPLAELRQDRSAGHVTVMLAISAAGHALPPFCIKQGAKRKQEWLIGCPPGTTWVAGGQGSSMTQELFLPFVEHFIKSMDPAHFDSPLPTLLLIDNHISRVSGNALELARGKNISVLTLPSNTTHFLQPCDSHANALFKRGFDNSFAAHSLAVAEQRAMPGAYMTGAHITAGMAALTQAAVQASWRDTGLWPPNLDLLHQHPRARQPALPPIAAAAASSSSSAAAAAMPAAVALPALVVPPPAAPLRPPRRSILPSTSATVLTSPAFIARVRAYEEEKQSRALKKKNTEQKRTLAAASAITAMRAAAAAAAVPPAAASAVAASSTVEDLSARAAPPDENARPIYWGPNCAAASELPPATRRGQRARKPARRWDSSPEPMESSD